MLSQKGLIIFTVLAFLCLVAFLVTVIVIKYKFVKRCEETFNSINANSANSDNWHLIDESANKISKGFKIAYTNFKNSKSGKPSDFINSDNALDDKVNYPIFASIKFLTIFYSVVTGVLLLFMNVVLKYNDSFFKALFSSALIMPFIYGLLTAGVIVAYYFVHKKYIYKMSVDGLNKLLHAMDVAFSKEDVQEETEDVVEENEIENTNEETEVNINDEELSNEVLLGSEIIEEKETACCAVS